jgi:hypothetical protein
VESGCWLGTASLVAERLEDRRCGGLIARSDVHLTYMTSITLTTEFVLSLRGA